MTARLTNDEQIHNWNHQAGPRWVAQQDDLDAQLSALGRAAMDTLGSLEGTTVLDIGCGCGATTLQLRTRVGPSGRVVGVDVSAVMLDRARSRTAGDASVDLHLMDVQSGPLGDSRYDVAFSRFGVMFFADPVAAFANVLRSVKPGGRLGFVCWQAMSRNPWMAVPLDAVLPLLPSPPVSPPPGAPGPFGLADPDRVRGILRDAGWTDVGIESHAVDIAVGGAHDLESAVEVSCGMGPASAALRECPPEVLDRARDAVRAALARYRTDTGVKMASATWLVTARRPP